MAPGAQLQPSQSGDVPRPIPGEERLAILNFNPEQKLPLPEAVADPLQSLLLELTRLCLRHEVARRPSAAELLQFVLSRRPALPRVRRRRHRLRPRPRHSWPQLAAATSLTRARALATPHHRKCVHPLPALPAA